MAKTMYGGPDSGGYSGGIDYDPETHGALLPCPFCGSTNLEVENTHTPSYWVECLDCEAQASGDYDLEGGSGGGIMTVSKWQSLHQAAITTAVSNWNRRVLPPEALSAEKWAELRAAVAKLIRALDLAGMIGVLQGSARDAWVSLRNKLRIRGNPTEEQIGDTMARWGSPEAEAEEVSSV